MGVDGPGSKTGGSPHDGTLSEMEGFFNPRGVAVAGASKTGMKLGNVVLSNLLRLGYRGRIYPLHPEGGEIMGIPAYPDLRSLGEAVDLAVSVLPRESTQAFVEECAAAGVRRVIVSAAGFADDGEEGRRMQERLAETARRSGMRLMGPNSVGTVSTHSGLATSLMTLEPLRPGNISIVAQTGLFAGGFARWISSTQRFGLAKVACLGNKADVDEVDVLAYLQEDPQTAVVAVYTEGLRHGRKFLELAREVTERKPIVLLKGGRTDLGARMAAGHTGSLAGEDAVYRGALTQAGVVQVEDIEGLFGCAKALSYCPLPRGPKVGVVSITGAGTVLVADACRMRGLELPPLREETLRRVRKSVPEWASLGNPADIWSATLSSGVEGGYRELLRAVAGQEDVDLLVVLFTLVPESEFDAASFLGDVREEHPEKPVLACLLGASREDGERWFYRLEEIGIPVYTSIERCVEAAWALVRAARRRAAERREYAPEGTHLGESPGRRP
ncbi:CoA-binding protein [Candidatus Solincola tengchongensis]|uniref:acetate--CoA ligase family protein n=1 Tax=Candidatus Solincola tengchongensis TaxID=2900693 RepID=UPI00257AB016|nr:CoA-binding protein [Candidatus Solincola tengchongensis]